MRYSKESKSNYTAQLKATLNYWNKLVVEKKKTANAIDKWSKFNLTKAKGKNSRVGYVVGATTNKRTELNGIKQIDRRIGRLKQRILRLQRQGKINKIL